MPRLTAASRSIGAAARCWAADRSRIIAARGRNIGIVAAAQTAHLGLLRPARR
jgi:hypothetical protein